MVVPKVQGGVRQQCVGAMAVASHVENSHVARDRSTRPLAMLGHPSCRTGARDSPLPTARDAWGAGCPRAPETTVTESSGISLLSMSGARMLALSGSVCRKRAQKVPHGSCKDVNYP